MYDIPVTVIFILLSIWLLNLPLSIIYLVGLAITLVYLLRANPLEHSEWKNIVKNVYLIGHKCCTSSPENTIPALLEAVEHQVKAVEIDIAISQDGVLYLMHDSTIDRTTNGSGLVNEWLWKDLKKLSASNNHPKTNKFQDVLVPSLEEFLTSAHNHGVKVFLDVKGGWNPLEMAQKIVEMKEKFPDLHTWLIVCSFYPQTLYAVKWYNPSFSTILTHRPDVLTYRDTNQTLRNDELWKRIVAPHADSLLKFADYYLFWWFCGVNGFLINEEVYNVYDDKWWKKRGISLFAWTVNSPQRKEYLRYMDIPYITDDVINGN